MSVEQLIIDGGAFEDEGNFLHTGGRYYNHFHNPLKPWPQAGLSITFQGVTFFNESSLLWAQRSAGTQQYYGNYSWHDARGYFYNALTSTEPTVRDQAFADTFRAVGQVMHLVEDASVPAHTRNDAHLIYNYEWWVQDNESFLNITPIFSTAPLSVSISGYVPITQFWDTNQYDGSLPLTGTDIGLAEYSNGNFLSDDTIFSDDFPYPNKSLTELWTDQTNNRKYLRSIGRGEPVQHQAAVSLLYAYRLRYFPQYSASLPLALDDKSYEEQAKHLIPRAVGYSAGLLDYFFRGKIDLVPDQVTGSGYVIVNETEEDLVGSFELYYDDTQRNRILLWSESFTLGAKSSDLNRSPNITFSPPMDALEQGKYTLVFKGRLGQEEGAVVGREVRDQVHVVIVPVDHTTRETLGKRFYRLDSTLLVPEEEADLPFGLVDDGGYWDEATQSWTVKAHPEGLGVPLGTGGPQTIAKYWDSANQRVRFILNGSYEKEAYHAFHFVPKEAGQVIKDLYYLTFVGSPLTAFGMYNENPGWMDYTTNGLLSILSPPPANPQTRFFPLYKGANFNDIFVQAPIFRFYNFDKSLYEAAIPKDPDAPTASIISADRPDGTDTVTVSVPSVFNSYVRPNTYWINLPTIGSSGLDHYLFHPNAPPTYDSHEDKCSSENNNCGNVYDPNQGAKVVNPVYVIPYNDHSYVKVHNNDGGQYYEELYIHGQLRQTSAASPDKLVTHYQILAVHKDAAVIRETNFISEQDIPVNYTYAGLFRIHELQRSYTSHYYLYVNGAKYDLTGTTDITSRLLTYNINEPPTGQPVDYLTFEVAEDITGYHLDRIFISETFDGGQILVAFDEYAYNGGAGLVHRLNYEPADNDAGKYFLYYGIPAGEIQNADHEGRRDGRKILLFGADGALNAELQDPVGLEFTIGSIGTLN